MYLAGAQAQQLDPFRRLREVIPPTSLIIEKGKISLKKKILKERAQ